MENKPNIFDFATSELTQDAFIAWLINWSDKNFKTIDYNLHKCAISFVQKLLMKDHSYSINSVKVGRQWKNIDVWALINNEYFIVIEDKKGTTEHSNQLVRYSEIAKEKYANTDIEIKLIYFKMEEQGKYSNIEKAGFTVFKRDKMLSLLYEYISTTPKLKQNDIIADYYYNLIKLDKNINSYTILPLDEWHWHSWQGFYSKIKEHIGGNWEYVSNASGGFLGFFINWSHSKINEIDFEYYIQIEQNRIVYKLYVYDESERKNIRSLYRNILFNNAKQLGINITKHGRLGKYMGVAKLNNEYRITDNNGHLDFEATLKIIKKQISLINNIKHKLNCN